MDRVRYGYAAAAWIMDYYEYNVRICLALLYPPQALDPTTTASGRPADHPTPTRGTPEASAGAAPATSDTPAAAAGAPSSRLDTGTSCSGAAEKDTRRARDRVDATRADEAARGSRLTVR